MSTFDLPETPPAWLKQVMDPDATMIGTMGSDLAPGEIISKEVGGDLWTAPSLRDYCKARFGNPRTRSSWLLATDVPQFYVLAQPGRMKGVPQFAFGYQFHRDVIKPFTEQFDIRNRARGDAWVSYLEKARLSWNIKASVSVEAQRLHQDKSIALYKQFIADGSEARALASCPAPLVDAVYESVRAVGRELMRPVMQQGRAITMMADKAPHTVSAPAP